MEKVVLDLNTIISGALFHGNEEKILALAKREKISPIISKKMVSRLSKALNYLRLAKYLHGRNSLDILAHALENFEIVDHIDAEIPFDLDDDDKSVLLCALNNGAKFLVSGDEKLLEIKHYKGIKIVSSHEFLDIIQNLKL